MKWKSKLGQKSGLKRAVNDTQAKVEQTHTVHLYTAGDHWTQSCFLCNVMRNVARHV